MSSWTWFSVFKHGPVPRPTNIFGHTIVARTLDPASLRLTGWVTVWNTNHGRWNLPRPQWNFVSPLKEASTQHLSIKAHNKMSINHRIMTVTPYWKPITMCHNRNSFTQRLIHYIAFIKGLSLDTTDIEFKSVYTYLLISTYFSQEFIVLKRILTSPGLHSHTRSQSQSGSILPPSSSGSGSGINSRSQERTLSGVTTDKSALPCSVPGVSIGINRAIW